MISTPEPNYINRKGIYRSLKLLVLFLLYLFAIESIFPQKAEYTTPGDYEFTVPEGVTQITVECWGGGGAGGGVTSNNGAAGGGAGGAYAIKTITVTPGQKFDLKVAERKAGTTSSTSTNGNPSWFGSASNVYAEGGAGAPRVTGNSSGNGAVGSAANSKGDQVYKGGDGANGDKNSYGGGGGGAAGPTGEGGDANNATGGAGNSSNGNGGNGSNNNADGRPGNTYGGGGAGAKNNSNFYDRYGGAGASGRVIIKWPDITVSPNQINFEYILAGTYSSPQSYTINGENLKPNNSTITISAPQGFQISLSPNSGFNSTFSIPYSNKTLTATVYVRFAPQQSDTDYSGNISNSGGGAGTVNVAVSGSSFYCVPVQNESPGNYYIQRVILGEIDNQTGALTAPYYSHYNLSTNVIKNQQYTLSLLSQGFYFLIWSYTNYVSAWIDFNHNGQFESSEKIGTLGFISLSTKNFTFSIPQDAKTGVTRMRVRSAFNEETIQPCEDNYAAGETEDYDIIINGTLQVSGTSTESCEGGSTGSITVNVSGGTAPYQYKINDSPFQFPNVFSGLSAGNYSVTVKDANDITGNVEITVSSLVQTMPPVTATITNSTCNSSDGAITVTNIPTSLVFTKSESNYVDFQTSVLNNLSKFTLEGWIKLDKAQISGSRTWGLLGQNDAIEFGIMDNTTLQLWSNTGGTLNVPMSEYPDDDDWHHVAAVGNGTQMAIYIDGNMVGSLLNNVSNYGSSSFNTVIGGHIWDATGNYFNGSFLKAGFWSRAFTAEEIQSLLNTKFKQYNSNEPGLISGFNFFEGTGNTLSSVGSANITGSINNTPHWEEVFTYQWTKTGDPGFSSTSKNISSISEGEYSFSAFLEGICPVSNSWTITSSGNNQWTGNSDINWNNPGNWTCNVPTIEDDGTIPSGLYNYPLLQDGNNGTINNLIIAQGASLTIINNTMQIAGSILNEGTFNSEQGTIKLCGEESQQIGSDCFTTNTIKSLIINNSNDVSLNGTLRITGIVQALNGNLISNGNLILNSDVNSSALVDGSGLGEIIGEVTIERYLPSAYGYKYISSPFQNMKVGEFADDVDLNSSFASFWKYDESNETTGWEAYIDPAALLDDGSGYALNFGTTGGEKTISGSGIVNNGTIGPLALFNHNKTYTLGFNLLGNPYPSPINWEAAGWNKVNVDNAIYYFDAGQTDPYTGTYSSYVDGISSDGQAGAILPSQQGFFVHVNTDQTEGSLTFSNAARVTDLNPVFHKSSHEQKSLIRLSAKFENNNSSADFLVLYFKPDATESFNPSFDALKILNTDPGVPNIYFSTIEKDKSSIKSFPSLGELKIIPIGISASTKGKINISISDIQELQEYFIYLKDKHTGKVTDLKFGNSYSFDIDNTVIDDRFLLIFSTEIIKEEAFGSASFIASCENGTLYVQLNLMEEQVNFQLTDMSGKIILSKDIYGEGKHTLGNVSQNGIGIITMSTGMGMVSKKILLTR